MDDSTSSVRTAVGCYLPCVISPLLLGMLETARVLLRMEKLAKRIENRDMGGFDTSSSQSTSSRGSVVSSGAVEQGGVKGADDEVEELGELRWKIGKLMEIFLSDELQVC